MRLCIALWLLYSNTTTAMADPTSCLSKDAYLKLIRAEVAKALAQDAAVRAREVYQQLEKDLGTGPETDQAPAVQSQHK